MDEETAVFAIFDGEEHMDLGAGFELLKETEDLGVCREDDPIVAEFGNIAEWDFVRRV